MERKPKVHAQDSLSKPAEPVAQIDQPCSICLQRSSPGVNRIQSIPVALWTFRQRTWYDAEGIMEVNIPEVKTSYEYVTELRESLEDSLKLAQEELKSPRNATRSIRIRRPSQVNVVPTNNEDGANIAVAGVIHQDIDQELGWLSSKSRGLRRQIM